MSNYDWRRGTSTGQGKAPLHKSAAWKRGCLAIQLAKRPLQGVTYLVGWPHNALDENKGSKAKLKKESLPRRRGAPNGLSLKKTYYLRPSPGGGTWFPYILLKSKNKKRVRIVFHTNFLDSENKRKRIEVKGDRSNPSSSYISLKDSRNPWTPLVPLLKIRTTKPA